MDCTSLQESLGEFEYSVIREFCRRVSDLKYKNLNDDVYVARWLKARNWDIEKAEKMFRMHLDWKIEIGIDDLLSNFTVPEVFRKYFPGGICGNDKHGRPVFICPAGNTDVFGLMKSASRTELSKSMYHTMEYIIHHHLPSSSVAFKRPVDQLVIIFDLQHMNRRQLWRPWLNFVQEMTAIFEVNYPELMAVCYVLNAPSFFSLVFSLIKPLLSKETQEKIYILGSNYRDVLLTNFDPEHLPLHYGGSMTDEDGDPKCPSRICWGGTVPEQYYIQQPFNPSTENGTDVDKQLDKSYSLISVGRGGKEYFFVGNVKAGETIWWKFFTESNDIAFSLWMLPAEEESLLLSTNQQKKKTKENNVSETASFLSTGLPSLEFRGWLKNGVMKLNSPKPIESEKAQSNIPTSLSMSAALSSLATGSKPWQQFTQSVRVDCDLVPESDHRKVEVNGSYYMIFDNSYSWTRSKRVWCRIDIQHTDANTPRYDAETCNSTFSPATSEPNTFLAENGVLVDLIVPSSMSMDIDVSIDEVLKEITNPSPHGYQLKLSSQLDVDLSALAMVLLRTLPLIRRCIRSKHEIV